LKGTHDAYILGGVRTPIGRYAGALSGVRTDDLLAFALTAACERVGVAPGQVEEIAAGCVNPAHEGMGDIARWAALAAGFPDHVPAYTVNRFCASSLTCTVNVASSIAVGELRLGMAAGVESMSRSGWAFMKGEAPFMPRGPRFMLDTMWAGAGGPPNPELLARDAYIEMIRTAQNVATKYEIPRREIDGFALRSHTRAALARDNGRFAKEIAPIEVPGERKQPPRSIDHDEGIRDDTTLQALERLPPQPGTEDMTAGNSSPLSDGASAILLASGEQAEELGVRPLARVLSSASVGVDPTVMGIAPAYAMPRAIEAAGIEPQDVDVYEVHEAFAAQVLAVLREFEAQTGWVIPDDRLNPNGGAVALGHPFGDSGTRCVLTLATELEERGARYGCTGICVGSGQGVALVIERYGS
jgi:acetyl-CoA acetyltransferase family protein